MSAPWNARLCVFQASVNWLFWGPLPTAPSSHSAYLLSSSSGFHPGAPSDSHRALCSLLSSHLLASGFWVFYQLCCCCLHVSASSSLSRVWISDPLSDAQKSINLQEAECLVPQKRKGNDFTLEKEEMMVETICVCLFFFLIF